MGCINDREAIKELSQYCQKNNRAKCKSAARNQNLFVNGIGDGRFVFSLAHRKRGPIGRDCVVKIPHHEFGVDSNIEETETWERVEGTKYEKFLAPVLESDEDGDWLTMPVAINIGDVDGEEMRETMKDAGIICRDFEDTNYGMLSGKRVMIDYGDGCELD